jgi:chaperonin cofactor prefoldin
MSSLRERNLLYARLEEVLGTEPAEVLMSQFPTESDLATRFDVTNLGARFNGLEARFDSLETRFDSLETRFDGLETRFDGLERRFDRLEVRFDVLEGRVDQIDAHMDRLEAHMVRFDDKLDGFHQALREQSRAYMLTMTGVMASFSAVIVATGILT